MTDGLDLAGQLALGRLARAFDGADKPIQRRVRAGLRAIATPLGEKVRDEGSATMPSSHGFQQTLLDSKPSVRTLFTSRTQAVDIRLGAGKPRHAFAALNKGILKHPAFARKGTPRDRWRWVQQKVSAGTYSRAFDHQKPAVALGLYAAANAAVADIAVQAKS